MKRLTARDGVATAAVLAVLVPYVVYLNRTPVPSTQDPRGMVLMGLAGLFVSVSMWGLPIRTTLSRALVGGVFGSIGLAIGALFIDMQGGNVLLALFMGVLVLLWITRTFLDVELVDEAY